MGRTAKSDAIRDAFIDMVRAQGVLVESIPQLLRSETNENIRDLFLALGHHGREIYLIQGVGFVNIHVRAESQGWWNLQKSVKSDLDALASRLGRKPYYIFLVGRRDHHIANGYIATDFSSSPFIMEPSGEETKYTIKEGKNLDSNKMIFSIEKIAETLVPIVSK